MTKHEPKRGIYALSADPIHNGHIYNIKCAMESGLIDELLVAVGVNYSKKTLFNLEERSFLVSKAIYSSGFDEDKVKVGHFDGLLRNYALREGYDFIIRGARHGLDFDYEQTLSCFNGEYGLQTLVFPSPRDNRDISSGFVKAVASEGGFVHGSVHSSVKQALEERLRGVSLIGVTGNIGSGKTTFCENLKKYAYTKGQNINYVDLDKIIRSLYDSDSFMGKRVRNDIKKEHGEEVFRNGRLDRKKLGEIVFNDEKKRRNLAELIRIPTLVELEETLRKLKGMVLVEAAYFTEYNLVPIVNNNVILVDCCEDERMTRVSKRDKTPIEKVILKDKAQDPYTDKKRKILDMQSSSDHGFFLEVNNEKTIAYESVLNELNKNFPLFK